MQAKQNKEFIHYFPSAGRCSSTSRKAGLCHAQRLLGKTNAIALNVPLFLLLYMLSMASYGMGYPFGQLGSAVPAVSALNFLCSPRLLTSRVVWEAEKAFTLCKHCSAV